MKVNVLTSDSPVLYSSNFSYQCVAALQLYREYTFAVTGIKKMITDDKDQYIDSGEGKFTSEDLFNMAFESIYDSHWVYLKTTDSYIWNMNYVKGILFGAIFANAFVSAYTAKTEKVIPPDTKVDLLKTLVMSYIKQFFRTAINLYNDGILSDLMIFDDSTIYMKLLTDEHNDRTATPKIFCDMYDEWITITNDKDAINECKRLEKQEES